MFNILTRSIGHNCGKLLGVIIESQLYMCSGKDEIADCIECN